MNASLSPGTLFLFTPFSALFGCLLGAFTHCLASRWLAGREVFIGERWAPGISRTTASPLRR